jgi:tetratricopeptide (TPR) repeat protein
VAVNDLGVVFTMQRKYRQAETLLREALALFETALGPDHPMLASSLKPLTSLLLAQRRYAEAVVPAERAWHILQAASVRYPKLEIASVTAVLGLAYSHAGRPAEAESCARQAVSMAEEVYGSENPRLGFFLATSAATLRQIDRKNEAQEMQNRANAILERRARATSGGDTVSVSALR